LPDFSVQSNNLNHDVKNPVSEAWDITNVKNEILLGALILLLKPSVNPLPFKVASEGRRPW
jgi:hypothetical protein